LLITFSRIPTVTAGPNLRFFEVHRVKGVFEEGALSIVWPEMPTARWVLAQLLWNPQAG